MFSIFKKRKTPQVNLSQLAVDMHSHLLPGIDDGSPDVETSLMLMQGLKDLGFSKFITTPHILWDMYKNDPTTIAAAKDTLQSALYRNADATPLKAAAEYYLDDHFDELLQFGQPLLTIRKNWVLVEFSFVSAPLNLKEKIFELQIKGYQPVLAHPERYLYLSGSKSLYDSLKDAGCLFQVNLLSLAGYYGRGPQELALYLMKKNYIDLLGTDLHHERHLHALRTSPQLMEFLNPLMDSGKILNPGLSSEL